VPRTYSDRVMRFRKGVFASRRHVSSGCQLLLLRLSDDMNANAVVSVPRSTLAKDLDCPPARITEWISEAKEKRFLDVVRRARPKVTAVYQGLLVDLQRYAPADLRGTDLLSSEEVRPAVAQNDSQRYAQHLPQEVQVAVSGTDAGSCAHDDGIDEEQPEALGLRSGFRSLPLSGEAS
jgi:hypothetical protein